jgi:hypothetical protein
VLRAQVPNASGAGRLRAPDAQRAAEVLRTVLAAAERTVVHCCAPGVPVGLLRRAGAGAVALDVGLLTTTDHEDLGEAVEAGTGLLAGLVPSTDARLGDEKAVLAPLLGLWDRIGLDTALLPAAVAVTPTCGLAGATPAHARAALGACAAAGARLTDLD